MERELVKRGLLPDHPTRYVFEVGQLPQDAVEWAAVHIYRDYAAEDPPAHVAVCRMRQDI